MSTEWARLLHFRLMFKPSSRKLADTMCLNEQRQRELCSWLQNAFLIESRQRKPRHRWRSMSQSAAQSTELRQHLPCPCSHKHWQASEKKKQALKFIVFVSLFLWMRLRHTSGLKNKHDVVFSVHLLVIMKECWIIYESCMTEMTTALTEIWYKHHMWRITWVNWWNSDDILNVVF